MNIDRKIATYLRARWNGQAWFNAGSYSYLFKRLDPTTVMTSDGGQIDCTSWSFCIDEFSDHVRTEDLVDMDYDEWDAYFRADIKGQEDHELRNLRGD